jgi:glutamate dehydrogenase
VARGLIALFDARHDPKAEGSRDEAVKAAEDAINHGLAHVAAIDEDRILRLIRGVIDATLRTNAFAESGREALAFKLDSCLVPGLPAPVPWREIWVYSPRVEGIICAAVRSLAAAFAGPTGATISEPRSLA